MGEVGCGREGAGQQGRDSQRVIDGVVWLFQALGLVPQDGPGVGGLEELQDEA
jgi:hypothetical protein